MTRQPLYFDGMSDALARLDTMDETELLRVLDDLYGRSSLRYGASTDELREEARRQVRQDFTNQHPDAVAARKYLTALAAAARRNGGFA